MAGLLDLTGFLSPVVKKLASYIPDPEAKAKAEAEATTQLLNFQNEQNQAQLKVDTAEANNKNVFVAGWRPAVGWTCAVALAWVYVVQPFIASFVVITEAWPHFSVSMLPQIDVGQLFVLIGGMLGFGGLRTAEKIKGIAPPGAQ